MKKNVIILIFATVLFSCKRDHKSMNLDPVKNIQSEKLLTDNKDFYTQYKYTYSNGANVIIQNSYPKGGTKYTDQNGEKYVYAVFWTQIINKTDNPLELKIDFSVDSYKVPSLPDKYFKILVPSETMTIDKVPLFNYGLTDLESFLDSNIDKPASLKRTINPKESSGFYVVILSLIESADGTLRTGFRLKGQDLFYKINNKEIPFGSINFRK